VRERRADRSFRLYKSSEHADCTIICGSYSFRAHKAVLCSQSKFFKTALKSGTFKVRHSTALLASLSLTATRKERLESSDWKQHKMVPTILTPAMTRKSSIS
jgi:hypothetical protein